MKCDPRHDNLKCFLRVLKARPPGSQAQASSSCLALQLHLNLTASEQVVFAASLAMPGDRIILIKPYNSTSERTNLKENDMIMYNYVMVDDLMVCSKKKCIDHVACPPFKLKVVLAPT